MTSELLQLHTQVSTELQTPFGGFTVSVPPGEPGLSDRTCVALHRGPLDQPGTLVRIHSACLFSETFSSMDCDCADQLRSSMELIAREGRGVIVYQYQEGRGQGLEAKIRGMAVMDRQNLTTAGGWNGPLRGSGATARRTCGDWPERNRGHRLPRWPRSARGPPRRAPNAGAARTRGLAAEVNCPRPECRRARSEPHRGE
ncbi:hypothetical protein J7E97_13665 [Streptomyces sp. ISL-66]|uniref:hypothetical protein n=1 Tax=Streptomyces sp. ISL-66 TaxID=2819186 RepID=UPI001BE947A7|nr:hypothetical protein [Streptomyces sp. ISL-66]